MDTVLAIVLLAGSVAFVIEEEVRVRKASQRAAHDRPLIVETARLEVKLRRRAEELRSHLTDEDLAFLAVQGSDFAQAAIDKKKRELAAKKRDALAVYESELFIREGRNPWTPGVRLNRIYDAKTHRYLI
jgi:hypothetical protein